MPSQGVTNVANAIINKINNLISSHNSNSNAHQDIRNNIPSASSATPSADTTSGSVGTGTTWARSDHTHPKSNLYADSNKLGDINYFYASTGNPVFDTDNLYNNDLKLWDKLYYSIDNDKLYCLINGNDYDEIATLHDIPSLANYVQKSQTNGLLKNDGTIVQSGTGANNWATGNHTHEGYIQNQEFYFDGDDFVVISDEQTITKTLTIMWVDQNNKKEIRPRYLQSTINGITAYLSDENDWSVSVPVDTEDTYDWSIPTVLGYTVISIDEFDNNETIVTLYTKTAPSPTDLPDDEELDPYPIKIDKGD